jgi:hypothetical protein
VVFAWDIAKALLIGSSPAVLRSLLWAVTAKGEPWGLFGCRLNLATSVIELHGPILNDRQIATFVVFTFQRGAKDKSSSIIQPTSPLREWT